MTNETLLRNDWHVVALSEQVEDSILPFRLLNEDIAVWRSSGGEIHAFQDRCPHRGTPLSKGRLVNDRIVCAYHGWEFGSDGQCMRQPAQPGFTPPKTACVKRFQVREKYGLVWVCIGTPERDIFDMPNYGDPHSRTFVYGPYEIDAAGPRIVENFLDMAHFPYVHAGYLGDEGRPDVPDYKVTSTDEEIVIDNCRMWQPAANPNVLDGAFVDYVYWVKRPLIAAFRKLPAEDVGGQEAANTLAFLITPCEEYKSVAWKISVVWDLVTPREAIDKWNQIFVAQDKDIVESQRPKALPLDLGVEMHQRCDQSSIAYRRWLKKKGMTFGVTA